jgi:hypothetical protein
MTGSAGAPAPARDHPPPPPPPPHASRGGLLAELGAGAAATALLAWQLRHLLFAPVTRTFGHDFVFWYPVWQFFAEGLSLGELRLWNPLSYGGVPLLPALLQLRAFDPISLLVIAGGGLLTPDLLARYNWDVFLRALLPALASQVFLRRFAEHTLTRVALLLVCVWSSFLLVLLRVPGADQGFLWAPLVGILLYRLVWIGDGRWRIWAGLAIFMGLNWQSYFFAPHALFAVALVLALAVFHGDRARRVLSIPRLLPKACLAALLLAAMAAPLATVARERHELIYLPRVLDTDRPAGKVGPIQYEPLPSPFVREVSLLMPMEFLIQGGTHSTIWNFLQLVTPTGNWYREGGRGWGNPSEAFMYLGLPVYALALLGLVAIGHPLKRVWVTVLAVFGLLMLGPLGGLYSFLAVVFPLVRFTRHTHTYAPYFQLAILFFFVLGADHLLRSLLGRPALAAPALVGASPRRLRRVAVALGVLFLAYLLLVATPASLRVFSLGKAVTPAAIALGLVALWWLGHRLAPMRVFWLLLLGHLAAVPLLLAAPVLIGLHTPPAGGLLPTLGRIALYWLVFLLLPLAIYRAGLGLGARGRGLAAALLFALLAADQCFYLTYSDYPWDWPRPDRLLGTSAEVTRLHFSDTRGLFPAEVERTLVLGQALRYPELLLRQPYLLTAPRDVVLPGAFETSPERVAANLEILRRTKRWNSFYIPRSYFSLLHSEVPAPVLARLWALGEPMLRFAPAYAVAADGELEGLLRHLGPSRGRCLLATTVVLPEEPRALTGPAPSRATGPGPAAECDERALDPTPLTVTRYDANEISLELSAPSPGFVLLSDRFHPRWIARVDGRPVPVLRANGDFKAVLVPAGRHAVTLRFEASLLLIGIGLFGLLGLAALVSAVGLGVRAMWRNLRVLTDTAKRFTTEKD